jgi:hypothetical protein
MTDLLLLGYDTKELGSIPEASILGVDVERLQSLLLLRKVIQLLIWAQVQVLMYFLQLT